MLALLADLQKVELVGGESWFEHNSVAFAAIAAASLAAIVAVLNRRAELRHDREMRNREHIREIVDASYAEVGQAIRKVSALLGVVHGTEEWREETGRGDAVSQDTIDRELREATDNLRAVMLDLVITGNRLQMRLGREHAIATSHKGVQEAIESFYEHVPASLTTDRGKQAREADNQRRDVIGSAFAGLREACFEWINE